MPSPHSLFRAILAVLTACVVVGTARGAGELDPKDGPDVDLRIAVEDGEVRLQIITNLAFLDETTDAYREDESTLDPSEAPAAMDALVELFRRDIEVKVDGAVVAPLAPDPDRDFEYDQGDASLIPHFVNFGARAVARTRLTLRYPCKSPPDRVSIIWGTYPDNVTLADDEGVAPPIEILCRLAAGGVDRIVRFQREEPQFIWHRAAEEDGARMAPVPPIRQQESPPCPPRGSACSARRWRPSPSGPRASGASRRGPCSC